MFLKQLALIFVGFSAGGIIAAGVFAFIVTIGVVTRMIGKSHTARKARFYEDCIVAGGALGNLLYLYTFTLPVSTIAGNVAGVLFGFFSGIFTGSLVMSLSETLNAIPVMSRRIHLRVGLQYLILAIAAGKCVGALLYFIKGFSGS